MRLEEIKKKVVYNNKLIDNAYYEVNRFFEFAPGITITKSDKGYDISDSIKLKEEFKIKLKELPFKINYIHGTLDLEGSFITSLKNFPNIGKKIDVSHCPRLHSLASPEPIKIDEFRAVKLDIVNLEGVQISTNTLELDNCSSLRTLRGLKGTVNYIYLYNCPQLEQDPIEMIQTIEGIKKVVITPLISTKVPMVKSILFALDDESARIRFSMPRCEEGDRLTDIITKYNMKGASQIVNLIRELRDAGFGGNARI